MAWREVDPGPAPELGKFPKFDSIGDKFLGVFVSQEEITNNFGRKQTRYHFKNKEGLWDLDANFDLDRRLKKIELKPGYKVAITFVANIPNTDPQKSAMKQFKVIFDDDLKVHTPPPAATPPPPPPEDDIGF